MSVVLLCDGLHLAVGADTERRHDLIDDIQLWVIPPNLKNVFTHGQRTLQTVEEDTSLRRSQSSQPNGFESKEISRPAMQESSVRPDKMESSQPNNF